jgi:ATP-dependent protease ClpP protease subunit
MKKVSKSNYEEEQEEECELSITRENNHIYFYSDISRESVFVLNTLLREAEKYVFTLSFDINVKDIPIYIHINSLGGSLYDAYTVINTIKKLRVPIYSIIEGPSASAATLISIVCNKRFICKNAYMLIHQLSGGMWGKMNEIEDEYKHLKELMEQIKEFYNEHTKIPKKELGEILKSDIWFNSNTCIKYGLADEVY